MRYRYGLFLWSQLLFCAIVLCGVGKEEEKGWSPDRGDGTYKNPVIFADYSDPDVVRVGDEFFLVSSSFNCVPGVPVLRSSDLVNWEIVGHAVPKLPSPMFEVPQQGKGIWAPSIRFHGGEFSIYYGDPDLGIFLVKSRRAEGPWDPPALVQEAKGWIDPCPLWDDDGNVYLVHAWAKSRAGFNSVLTVNKLSRDGCHVLDTGRTVFDGRTLQPTIEGPKFYKRNGYYYILAPAGGVAAGWQVALRSRNVYGPYEDRVVMDQGATATNGPHQGAWVETPNGDSWFVHFQELQPYGRVVHLQPMTWNDDWPVMGRDPDHNGKGEPVVTWTKPVVPRLSPVRVPQTGDDFGAPTPGLQWQWEANPADTWSSLTASPGTLRLFAVRTPAQAVNLWTIPNLLVQKFPAPEFTATTCIRFVPAAVGEKVGLVVMGLDYSYIALRNDGDSLRIQKVVCKDADRQGLEVEEEVRSVREGVHFLRVLVERGGKCTFSFSDDGQQYQALGNPFPAREGKWIGAQVGLFTLCPGAGPDGGHTDVAWWKLE